MIEASDTQRLPPGPPHPHRRPLGAELFGVPRSTEAGRFVVRSRRGRGRVELSLEAKARFALMERIL